MGLATLGGVPFRIDPDAVKWDFTMKVSETKTLGGKVIQILGTSDTSMTIAGDFGSGDKGDTEGWQAQRRFVKQVIAWTESAERNGKPLEFRYHPRNWHMDVFIEAFSSKEGQIEHTVTNLNPSYSLTLFMLSDRSRVVVKGITDLYIRHLMDGVGWKQTDYNGPTAEEVTQTLAGKSLREYLNASAEAAMKGPNVIAPQPNITPPTTTPSTTPDPNSPPPTKQGN